MDFNRIVQMIMQMFREGPRWLAAVIGIAIGFPILMVLFSFGHLGFIPCGRSLPSGYYSQQYG